MQQIIAINCFLRSWREHDIQLAVSEWWLQPIYNGNKEKKKKLFRSLKSLEKRPILLFLYTNNNYIQI